MRKFWILTKLQLLSLFGINKIYHQKEGDEKKKGKRSLRVLIVMVVALLYASVMYSGMLAISFKPMGQLPLMLGLMALATSLMILIFSMFEAKSVLYGFGDYDMIMSWPAPKTAVAASRIANMYAYNLVYALLLFVPAAVIYAMNALPPIWYYPAMLLAVVLLPCVPTVIGALLGTLVTVATARMKKSSLFSTVGQFILMIVLVGAMMWLNSGMTHIDDQTAMMAIGALKYYPLAAWVQQAACGNAIGLVWLLLVSLPIMLLSALGFSRLLDAVHGMMSDLPHGKAFTMERQKRGGMLRALYAREWKRYMASSIYVTNTAFGYVMLLAAGIAAVVVKNDAFRQIIADPALQPVFVAVPLIMGAIMAMSTTTGSAISIEGKQLWIVRTLPVPARELFLSKIMVSMTLAVPAVIVSSTLIALGLRLAPRLWPFMYVTPLAAGLFSAVFGLSVNLSLPRLDWTNETEIVKQSASMAASMFGALGIVAVPAVAVAVTGLYWLLAIATAGLIAAAWIIWRRLLKHGEERLSAL